MASANYVLLERITVGAAGASSVTFSGIPQTGYTDLVIKASVRCDRSSPNYGDFSVRFNSSTTGFTQRNVFGDGSSAGSSTSTYTGIDSAFATASTFSNLEIYIPNYTSANYKSFSIDNVTENNATEVRTVLSAGLWSNTAAITSVDMLEINSTKFVQYSTFYLYGVAKLGTTPAIVPYATGGDTIMTDGTYWYHAFLASGTFTPQKALTCHILTVGAGGGGGFNGGGGGGGELDLFTSQSLTSTSYAVTVGAAGAGSTSNSVKGTNGNTSSFATLMTSLGGGGGGSSNTAAGSTGGSGGGGAELGAGGSTSGSNTFAGGDGKGSPKYPSGGGGGATAVGVTPASGSSLGGNGGLGYLISTADSNLPAILSPSTYFSSGGGGGTGDGIGAGTGGTGAGNGGDNVTTAGTAATMYGAGGGGGRLTGGNGFAGVVVVRYPV